jgi:hypothetical protein
MRRGVLMSGKQIAYVAVISLVVVLGFEHYKNNQA